MVRYVPVAPPEVVIGNSVYAKANVSMEQSVERIDFMLPSLDPKWRFTDSNGHNHSDTTTLRWVVDYTYYCGDCSDEHEEGHYECNACSERIEPGTKVPGPLYIPGIRSITVELPDYHGQEATGEVHRKPGRFVLISSGTDTHTTYSFIPD